MIRTLSFTILLSLFAINASAIPALECEGIWVGRAEAIPATLWIGPSDQQPIFMSASLDNESAKVVTGNAEYFKGAYYFELNIDSTFQIPGQLKITSQPGAKRPYKVELASTSGTITGTFACRKAL